MTLGVRPRAGAVRREVGQEVRQFREQGLDSGAVARQEVDRYPRDRDGWQVAAGGDVDVLAEEVADGNGSGDGT